MKLKLVISSLVLLSTINLPGNTIKEITTSIKEVTVYLRGAQITRSGKTELPKGNVMLSITNLPENIDPQSIQVNGQGNFVILSVMHQINYLAPQKKPKEMVVLEDSLKILEEKMVLNNSLLQVFKNEEELILANRTIGSEEKGMVVSELKLAADFLRSRLTEIKKEQAMLAKQNSLLGERIEKIRNQLNGMKALHNKPTSEILISVEVPAETSGNIKLAYTVFSAGWIPVYDIRAVDVTGPVTLLYNAKVFQQTGEDWENVRLKLSTADPRQRGDKPNLTPWYIDFSQPITFGYENVAMPSRAKKSEMADDVMEDRAMEHEMQESVSTAMAYTEVRENQTNLEFSIKIPYDIPSDNKQYTLNIQEYKMQATYQYYCAPKIDRDAFLVARIAGWENFNLLSGELNLFFEETYVGKSMLNIRNTSDTLDISLGRDKNIIITRIRLTDFTADRTLGSTRQVTRAWEITTRNNKKQPIKILIEDLFPVSMNKEIQIEAQEYSGGSYNKETGKIQWLLTLNPSEEKKIRTSFTVKYPKDREVIID